MSNIVNRRRYMGGSEIPASEYIQNGLVFHLDGIEYGGLEGHWIDLIQNIDFLGNVNRLSNGLGFRFDMQTMTGSSNPVLPNTSPSIEMVIKDVVDPNDNNGITILGRPVDSSEVMIRLYKDNNADFLYKAGVSPKAKKYRLYERGFDNGAILYVDSNKCFLNKTGKTDTFNAVTGYGKPPTTYLGSTRCQFSLFSIRIYNRELSDEEVFYNQSIDSKRFKIRL